MKTHPSQRKFGLPVAIVASAHAILFLGFRSPHPRVFVDPPAKPATKVIELPIEDDPVIDVDNSDATEKNPARRGDPGPQIPDEPPTVPTDPTLVSIPTEPRAASIPSFGPINYIPTGPIGDPKGSSKLSSVGDLDFVPHALSRISPIYPASMKAAGVSGTVTVMFTVDTSGRVAEVSVVSASRPEFEEPAMRAVSHWRFEPGKRHGRPTAFRMTIPLNFVLEN
jgi:protein TonB